MICLLLILGKITSKSYVRMKETTSISLEVLTLLEFTKI